MTKLYKLFPWVFLKASLMGKQCVHQESNETNFYQMTFSWLESKKTTHLVHLAQIFCPSGKF